ncbi:MAG: excinuclease ABC subunit UvrA, partial [Alphaproteobacteria bacterium]|nr:excinuclease ABC subunit UvrA [Alphaproteobacteria bacterium]
MAQSRSPSRSPAAEPHRFISIRGAREHNLKNVDLDLPRDRLVVITGLSGSGKSSLAFDTIYAEGQRRYVESLSAYARQFLELMQKPDVDSIEGLSPAISIEQKTTSRNPRSTVGTVTEIYDYLRLLYARVGVPYSPATGLPIESQTVSQMVDRVKAMADGSRLYLMAPIVRGRKGEYRKELQELQKKGFQRVKVDGKLYEITEAPALDKKYKHDIDVVVDRIVVRPDLGNRLADSIETALELAEGLAVAENADSGERTVFSARFACPVSGFTIEEIEPRLFSFNAPQGACPACDGLGVKMFFDPEMVVPDDRLSLAEGAVAPWADSSGQYYMQTLESIAKHYKVKMSMPWRDLPKKVRDAILFGSGGEAIAMRYDDGIRQYQTTKPFEGVIPNLDRRWKETDSSWVREDLERFQHETKCEACGGARLKPEALAVKIGGLNISQVTEFAIGDAVKWFAELNPKLTAKQQEIAARILKEINERLGFLDNVGLSYLTLNRTSGTLSGGESQRVRLASQIGSGLTGVLYVLDEPSIGLHQRDNDRLLKTLTRLRDLGNTVLVVEHDEDAIRAADHLVDMGPGAGAHGGTVIAEGTPEDVMRNSASLTGQYLSGFRQIPVPKLRREPPAQGSKGNGRWLTVKGARENNLQNVTASIPLGTFTCVTGVSGSGKSTLIVETLYKALAKRLNGAREHPGAHAGLEGVQHLDKIVDIDQSPIGRTPRSNPATYTGAFSPIRDWFSQLPESTERGYKPGRFSFNVKGGRCEACQGDGVIKIEMHFLPDVYVQCDVCKGKRYNRETLEIQFRGKSIADVLEMTVDEGVEFFRAVPPIRDKLLTLQQVGLGYIHVGQQATTLSGGEAQRVKLAKELSRRATGRTLYILDEPTTGLHFEDVRKLLEVLHKLVEGGNT